MDNIDNHLPPIDPTVFEMTFAERAAMVGLETTQDIEELRKVAIGCYKQGLRDAKMVKHLLKRPQAS